MAHLKGKIGALASILAFMSEQKSDGPREFGKGGEFTIERERGSGLWHVTQKIILPSGVPALAEAWHMKRAHAFEAAADVARARGDSAEDCGKLRAGVRW